MTTTIEPSADEIERVRRALVEVVYTSGDMLRDQAVAAILATDRRAVVVGEPVAWRWQFEDSPWSFGSEKPNFQRRIGSEGMSPDRMEPLYASPPAPAVAFKPLVWRTVDDGRYSGGIRPGSYRAENYSIALDAAGGYQLDDGRFTFMRTTFADLEAAKAAAQADYEQRIRLALVEPAPQLSGNPGEMPAPAVAVPEGISALAGSTFRLDEDRPAALIIEKPDGSCIEIKPGAHATYGEALALCRLLRDSLAQALAAAPEPPATRSEAPATVGLHVAGLCRSCAEASDE
jgi:hypothetical protein